MIKVDNLSKTYKIALKKKGSFASLRSLLYREYKEIKALDNISFQIKKGELIGYIGPNGAGKSTTIKILSGILVPDHGECVINGFVPWSQRRRYVKNIGVVFGQRTQLWWDLPVQDSYDLLQKIYSIKATDYKRNLNQMVELLNLKPLLGTPVRQLSLGQRMRCDIAASLLHRPDILFLDEPTIGLDAVAKFAIRDFIRQVNKQEQTTIILTTHDMDDIEALASRIMIIGNGKIAFDGTTQGLRKHVPAHRYLILDFLNQRDAGQFIDDVNSIDGAELVSLAGEKVTVSFDPEILPPQNLVKRISDNFEFLDIAIEHPPVEELIARLYKEYRGSSKNNLFC